MLHSKGPSAAQLLHSLHVPASAKRNPVIGPFKPCAKELANQGRGHKLRKKNRKEEQVLESLDLTQNAP